MNNIIITINNIVWTITAILCWFYEDPVIEGIVFATTIICVIDLVIKLHKMNYAIVPFIKSYWLDILFLLPICKMFRAIRVIKAGKILKAIDISCDVAEISANIYAVIKRKS
jgi:hypothetical protein